MGCDHPSCVPVGLLAGELWHFEYFPTTTVRLLNFKNWLWSLLFEFAVVYQISSKLVHAFGLRRPQLLNVQCVVARQRPLPGQPHYGGHVGNVMGCDQPRFVPIGALLSELWYFQYFPTWRPSAILNFKNFNIWLRDCHCGPNELLCTKLFTRTASRRS